MSRSSILFLPLLLSATALAFLGCGPAPSGMTGPELGHGKDIRQPVLEYVVSAAFSPDDRFLLTGFRWEGKRPKRPRGLALWDVQAGKEVWARGEDELGGLASMPVR